MTNRSRFQQLVHIILADACTRSSWLRRIKYKTAWWAYRVAILNCSPRDEVLNWIFCQHFFLFWCQVSDKFHMSKTFKLGFWLYYILFILRVLNQLIQFLIADARSVVFFVSKFMQRIKHQWEQFSCYSSIKVNCDGFVNDILFPFFLGTHHESGRKSSLFTRLAISAVVASVGNFTSCSLYFLKYPKILTSILFCECSQFCLYDLFHFNSLHWPWYYRNNPFWLSHVVKMHLIWLDNLLRTAYTDQTELLLCSCDTWIKSLWIIYVDQQKHL